MVRLATAVRALVSVALLGALTACSAAPGASAIPAASPTAATTAVPDPVSSASEAAAPPTDSPAPSTSAKPRPSIDQAELEAFLTSSITLIDLAEGDLAVTVGYVDSESDEPFDLGTYTLAFTEQQTNHVPPGVYRLEFRLPSDSATGSSCTIELGDGEAYTFAAIDGAVAVARGGEPPAEAAELFISTSSLCLD